MSRLRRGLAILLVSLGVAAGTLAVATPAQAVIYSCDHWAVGTLGVAGYCDGTYPSRFHVWVYCRNVATGSTMYVNGPTRYFITPRTRMHSSASCPNTTGWGRVNYGLSTA